MLFVTNMAIAEELPYLVANKVNGTLTIHYPDGNMISTEALFGIKISDEYNNEIFNGFKPVNGATPKGEYTLKKYYSTKFNEYIMVFIDGKIKKAAIHGVWLGNPKQERVKRLKSTTPDDNRITSGCINIDPIFFNDYISVLPNNGVKLIIKGEGEL